MSRSTSPRGLAAYAPDACPTIDSARRRARVRRRQREIEDAREPRVVAVRYVDGAEPVIVHEGGERSR